MSYAKHYDILEAQRITEKSARCGENNQYVFKVHASANKTTISQAVEKIYSVKVKACNIVNRPGKHRARKNGHTKPFKVAYVTLESGQTINLTEEGE